MNIKFSDATAVGPWSFTAEERVPKNSMEKPLDILLVEDNLEDAELTVEAIRSNIPHQLTVLENGEKAILYLKKQGEYARSRTPDVVVLDLNLPRKNGFDVLREIKNDPRLKKMPVIVFTVADLKEEMLKPYGVRKEQYVKKSADYSQLIQAIKHVTQQPPKNQPEGNVYPLGLKSKIKILIVEDCREDVELIEEILLLKKKYEWQLTHVERLKEALQLLDGESFDVVVLDLNLPDSRGLETLKTIRKHKSRVPIVVMTGLQDDETGLEAVRNGAQDYLIKGQISAELFPRSLQYAMERAHLERVREELISYVNHELNNPLTVIKEGISQVAQGLLGEINDKQKGYLTKATLHINRLIRITDDLMDTTMLEFGKVVLKKETFNAVEVGKSALDSFRSFAANRGFDIRFASLGDEGTIFADKDRIQQILFNLLNNAFKYTEKGHIELSVRDKGHDIEFSVEDTGKGIPEENHEKIFKKFERLTPSKSSHAKGTGLGLFISRELVKLHAGRIWVESKVGEGSKFSFTIPKT